MLFEIEEGYDPPERLAYADLPLNLLSEGKSIFVPADLKGTPLRTRARIYNAAVHHRTRVRIIKTVKDGVAGWRVFGVQKPEPEAQP